MTKQSDIPALIERLERFLVAAELARGGSQDLIKLAPLEIHLYNIATVTKRELESYKAMLEDFTGEYLK